MKMISEVSGINNTNQMCDKILQFYIESKTESSMFNAEFNVISTKIPYSVNNIKCD